jgi:hypothetical protein
MYKRFMSADLEFSFAETHPLRSIIELRQAQPIRALPETHCPWGPRSRVPAE